MYIIQLSIQHTPKIKGGTSPRSPHGSYAYDPDGSYQNCLATNSSVEYFQGKHIPLFLLATALVVAGLVYTIILFSWQ